MQKKCKKIWSYQKKAVLLHPLLKKAPGAIAQLVEQRTENPCVPSSILGGTTKKRLDGLFFGAQDRNQTRVLRRYALSIIASNMLISQFSILGGTTKKRLDGLFFFTLPPNKV